MTSGAQLLSVHACALSETELRYAQIEKEALALTWVPPRVLWFILRLTRFQCTIQHVPGKSLCTADTLFRMPLRKSCDATAVSCLEIEQFTQAIRTELSASADHLETYAKK